MDGAGNNITPLFHSCKKKTTAKPKPDESVNDDVLVDGASISADESNKGKESGLKIRKTGIKLLRLFFHNYGFGYTHIEGYGSYLL